MDLMPLNDINLQMAKRLNLMCITTILGDGEAEA